MKILLGEVILKLIYNSDWQTIKDDISLNIPRNYTFKLVVSKLVNYFF